MIKIDNYLYKHDQYYYCNIKKISKIMSIDMPFLVQEKSGRNVLDDG